MPTWCARTVPSAGRRPTSIASSRSKPRRKAKQAEVEKFNRQANEVSKSIGKAKDAAERDARKEEGRRLREATATLSAEIDAIAAEADAILRTIPNLSHPDAPRGADDQANLEIRRGKTPPPKFDFQAAGSRRAGREARSDRFRRRGQSRRRTAFTFSRTTPCCWNWPCSATRSTC